MLEHKLFKESSLVNRGNSLLLYAIITLIIPNRLIPKTELLQQLLHLLLVIVLLLLMKLLINILFLFIYYCLLTYW